MKCTLTADADRLTECLVSKSSECSAMVCARDLLVTLLQSLLEGTEAAAGAGDRIAREVVGVDAGRASC